MAIWNGRSEHDLIGNGIGVHHGQWLQPGFSGVGAGIDSFFEYGMKAAILLGELSWARLSATRIEYQATTSTLMCFRTRTRQSRRISEHQTVSS